MAACAAMGTQEKAANTANKAPRDDSKRDRKVNLTVGLVAASASLLGTIGGSVITSATSINQQESQAIKERRTEDRGKRTEAYIGFINNAQRFFTAAFKTHGCVDVEVAQSMMVDGDPTLDLCGGIPKGEYDSSYKAYRESESKMMVYGTPQARQKIVEISDSLPKPIPEDPTGLTLEPSMQWADFDTHYKEFQRITRCDILADPPAGDKCGK